MITGYWAGLVVLVCFGIMIGAIKLAKKKFNIHSARKAFHRGGGILAMTFPWVGKWNYILPAILLACVVLIILRLTTKYKKNKESASYGDFLYDTGSLKSYGEVVFPMVMAFLTWITKLDPFLFVTPMAILTFADSSAALVGAKYGKTNMACTGEDKKTQCGSMVFFATCMIIVPICSFLLTDLSWYKIVIISLMVAVSATIFEMTASRGMDNLLIPLTTFLMLKSLKDLSYNAILIKFSYIAMIFLLLFLTRIAKLVSTFTYLQLAMMISISLVSACWYAAASIIVVSLLITFVQKAIKKLHVCIVKPSIICICYSVILLCLFSAQILPSSITAELFFIGNLLLIGYTLLNINNFLPSKHHEKVTSTK